MTLGCCWTPRDVLRSSLGRNQKLLPCRTTIVDGKPTIQVRNRITVKGMRSGAERESEENLPRKAEILGSVRRHGRAKAGCLGMPGLSGVSPTRGGWFWARAAPCICVCFGILLYWLYRVRIQRRNTTSFYHIPIQKFDIESPGIFDTDTDSCPT